MTAVTEVNRQLIVYQEDVAAVLQRHIVAMQALIGSPKGEDVHSRNGGISSAAEAGTPTGHPFDDPSSLLVGLLVRVAVPKKLVDRLVLQRVPQLLGLRLSAVRDDEVAQQAVATAKKQYLDHLEAGRTLALVGVVAAALLHTPPKPAGGGGANSSSGGGHSDAAALLLPSLILLVRFGEVDETFLMRHVSPVAEPPTDEELDVWKRSTAAAAATFVATEASVALQRRRRYIRCLWDTALSADGYSKTAGDGVAPGMFSRRRGGGGGDATKGIDVDDEGDDQQATASFDRGAPWGRGQSELSYNEQPSDSIAVLLARQREALTSMKQELARKNDEVYQLALAMREQQTAHAAEVQRLEQQMGMLTAAHDKQRKEQQEREAKLRPLIETVKPLHQLFKLVKEKLGMPQGTLEAVERALREATVVPRPRAE